MAYSCTIRFEKPEGAWYSPGETIAGKIEFTLKERILLRALAFKFSGAASVHFELTNKKSKSESEVEKSAEEHSPPSHKSDKTTYTNHECYVYNIQYLIGSEEAPAKLIDAGFYAYDFAVQLPIGCPSSLETEYGNIRYILQVFILQKDLQKLSCYTCAIEVCRQRDLRLRPHLLDPVNMEGVELFKRKRFWQRALQLHVNLPLTGYVPGERICAYVKILNAANAPLSDLYYKLNAISHYTGYNSKKKLQTYTHKYNGLTTLHSLYDHKGPVMEHLESLQIPITLATPTVDDNECKCIQMGYELEVIVRTKGQKREVSVRIPIEIGTTSLQQQTSASWAAAVASAPRFDAHGSIERLANFDAVPPYGAVAAEPSAPPASMVIDGACGYDAAMAPGTLREANFMKTAHINTGIRDFFAGKRGEEFKPKYLYYNMGDNIQEAEISSTTGKTEEQIQEKSRSS